MSVVIKNFLCIASLLCIIQTYAQTNLIRLKNRTFEAEKNVASFNYSSLTAKHQAFDGKIFCIIQFNETLDQNRKQSLLNEGIELFHYIPDNAYTAVITKNVSTELLAKQNIISISQLQPEDKLSARLLKKQIPSWAIKQANKVDVIVHFSKGITASPAKNYFISHQYHASQ